VIGDRATDVSIVIVSYNARADLERCLAALHDAPPAATHEVIVVDNASTDGSVDAARHWPAVHVIASDENRGFAAASNTGIRASRGRNVLLLNSDAQVPPGAIDRLIDELESRPDVAIVGPRLVDGEGQAELSFGSMISPLTELRQRRLVHALARRDGKIVARVEAMTRIERYPDWVSGACLLVRRVDADAVGLIDERYFMYTEDVDFCAAIRARGRRVLFTPAVQVVHLRGRSGAASPSATRAAYRRSHLAFYKKHHPLLAPFLHLHHVLKG
jgi:GT2 family glycosyltransferase